MGTLTRKDKQNDITYVKKEGLEKLKKDPFFKNASEIGENSGIFEVISTKKIIKHNLPIQIGCMIYNLSKLHMLKFVYDCMYTYLERKKWECLEMDTDSLYYAIAGTDFHSCL